MRIRFNPSTKMFVGLQSTSIGLDSPATYPTWPVMSPDDELKRLHWRAHHRGTREADMLVGGFFDAYHAGWSVEERAKFAEMLEEQDADILAWAHGTAPPPARFEGPMMDALMRLDYVRIAK